MVWSNIYIYTEGRGGGAVKLPICNGVGEPHADIVWLRETSADTAHLSSCISFN